MPLFPPPLLPLPLYLLLIISSSSYLSPLTSHTSHSYILVHADILTATTIILCMPTGTAPPPYLTCLLCVCMPPDTLENLLFPILGIENTPRLQRR